MHENKSSVKTWCGLMDGQVTVVAKKSLLFTGPFGLMGYMSGMTFIERRKNVETKQWNCANETTGK